MGWFGRTRDEGEDGLVLEALADLVRNQADQSRGRARIRWLRLLDRLERPPVPTGLRREIGAILDLSRDEDSPDLPEAVGRMTVGIGAALQASALFDEELYDLILEFCESVPARVGPSDARRLQASAERVEEAAIPARERAARARREIRGLVRDLAGELGPAEARSVALRGGVGLLDDTLAAAEDPEAWARLRADLVTIARDLGQTSAELQQGLSRASSQVAELEQALARAHAELEDARQQRRLDGLTGLLDRAAFDASLRGWVKTIESSKDSDPAPFCLVMVDVDHFKSVNDTHGHPAGDEVLRQVAARLAEVGGSGDVVARIGGEEFGLLLTDGRAEAALERVEQARTAVSAQVHPSDQGAFSVTISAGVAVHRRGESALALYKRCDRALYAAKGGGRDQTRRAA